MKLPGTPRPADRGSFGLRLTILVRLTWAMQLAVQAQNAISEVFELSPFTVTTSSDDRYLSTNAVSGTSLNTLLKDLPMSIQVINTDFLEDTGASDFEEALVYAAGVFTEDHETDWQLGAARGIPGGAAGDKSISSAGKSSLLGNRSYIRGMSVPYQYRMGFRYGGVVVTPYGNVALGGLLDTVNMQRLEVVKGPNATLYGTGVLSGIVNVIAKSPTPEPRYEAGLRAGSPDFLRFQADISGPLQAAGLPGQLLYRLAGATETRGHWTDYRSEQSDYWTLQLDYRPVRRIRMFLEYQDGGERRNGIGPQWFHDRIGAAHDSEFRNEFDEAYNWARLDGILEPLRRVDPDASSHSGLMLSGTSFRGGGRSADFRITGPDPHVQRNERNLLADIEFSPIEHCVLSIGTFLAEQATRTLNVRTQSDFPYLQVFLDEKLRGDAQLAGIWQSGGVFGVPMQNAVRTYNGQSAVQLPGPGESYLINPTWPDDAKFIQYWWEDAVVRSKSAQFRIRGAYSIEPARFPGTRHTVLLGYVYSHDDVDFPDGSIGAGNAEASVSLDTENRLVAYDALAGTPVADPFNKDGLYYRSIGNFDPLFLDGRNDALDAHSIVRAGDLYLNQLIENHGIYGVYEGRLLADRLRVVAGLRRDTYNARQAIHKRIDMGDDQLIAMADAAYRGETSADPPSGMAHVSLYYRDYLESANQGYFGYANRGGAPGESHGLVPGSRFQIFGEDQVADSYSLGISYDLTPQLTVYGLVSKGISPNTALRDGAGNVIPAEETLNHEIGLKFELWEGRISGTLAGFLTERNNGIWDVAVAPSPSKWADARSSNKRSSGWRLPAYDPATPTTYWIRQNEFINIIARVFGINPDKLNFAEKADQLFQFVKINDLPSTIPPAERAKLVAEIGRKTLIPADFAVYWTEGIGTNHTGIKAAGLDDIHEITLLDPATASYSTRTLSSQAILYAAFMERRFGTINYSPANGETQPPRNNNVDNRTGALVTFDEEISGLELEVFFSATRNLQFVLGYAHVEREANDSFNFVGWDSLAGTEASHIPPFSQLHRTYGWRSAGIGLRWVDYAAYAAARERAQDGIVPIASLPESAVEAVPDQMVDETIPVEEFSARIAAGQILLFVDKRGNVINEDNGARATDFTGILKGVSLNYNPEDEATLFGKYTFTEGPLRGLSLMAGCKYSGPARTWIEFNEIRGWSGLRSTPEVAARWQVDVAAAYRWRWQGVDWRLSLNIYNLLNDTYSVTYSTYDQPNPITGQLVTKRTEKYYPPTSFRLGLSMAF